MKTQRIIAGNWKMNIPQEGVEHFIERIIAVSSDYQTKVEVIIFPPSPYLHITSAQIKNTCLSVGAQNCYSKNAGAFTGEVSPVMLKALEVENVLLGHSERRIHFSESNEMIAEKILGALKNGIKVILCVGEKEGEDFKTVVAKQIQQSLLGITEEQLENITIAYEPVWAIGTGKTASFEYAENVHLFIREILKTQYSLPASDNMSLLYGGSVNEKNVVELLSQKNINGLLVGGASLESSKFLEIIERAVK